MDFSARQILIFLVSLVAVFAATAWILLQLIPQPHSKADYMVIGTMATLACMVTVFGFIFSKVMRGTPFFASRRPRPPAGNDPVPPTVSETDPDR